MIPVYKPIKPTDTHTEGVSTLAIADLIIAPRQRRDTPSVRKYIDEELAPSIAEHGLVQPIVVTMTEDNKPQLIAGWCRTQAFLKLGHTTIPYVLRSSISEDALRVLELEENLRRKDMHWTDYVLGIYETHQMKVTKAARDAETWGYRQTGALLGVQFSHVNEAVTIAKALLAGNKAVMEADSVTAAMKALALQKEDAAIEELARRSAGAKVISSASKIKRPVGPINPLLANQPLSSGSVSELLAKPGTAKVVGATPPAPQEAATNVELSSMLFHMDCHKWFEQAEPESVDLVYTDIPYAIDMDELKGRAGIERMVATHDVEENLEQMPRFIKGAYKVLKDRSWLMFWYDLTHHEKIINWLQETGFSPQMWPFVVCKTSSCENRAAHANFTKATEYVMLARKGTATLRKAQAVNYMMADFEIERTMQANPFAKPFDVSKKLLDAVGALPGMTMLDCYAGEGSIIRAAITLGLVPIAVEKDDLHFPRLVEHVKKTYAARIRGPITFS